MHERGSFQILFATEEKPQFEIMDRVRVTNYMRPWFSGRTGTIIKIANWTWPYTVEFYDDSFPKNGVFAARELSLL